MAKEVNRYAFEHSTTQFKHLKGHVDNVGDAYRHCVATGELSRRTNSFTARAAGRWHEYKNPTSKSDKNMDLYNNKVGANIGKKSKSFKDVQKGCHDAISKGKLQISPNIKHKNNKYK